MTAQRAAADDPRRDALVARWYELTRAVLPAMADAQRWPIRLDHCFMRVCLDAVAGAPWTATLPRPAVQHMSVNQLAAAVRVAEIAVADPARLVELNAASLAGRRRRRSGAGMA